MFSTGERISVVMPALNEQASVGAVVKEFLSLGFIDEVIVVDNDSEDGTLKEAQKAGAKVVIEKERGYGRACIRALKEADADIVVLVESDGTFAASDLIRMLEELKEADFVSGSRTSRIINEAGADMTWYKIAGNRVLGKLVSMIYGCAPLTDIGSTYVAVRKETLNRFARKLHIGDSSFSAEMYIAAASSGAAMAQIPIGYRARIGRSKLSSGHVSSIRIGFKHLKHVFALRNRYSSLKRPSLYYRNYLIYRTLSAFLYKGKQREKYLTAAEFVEEGATVLDVCCGDAVLRKYLNNKHVAYSGMDINNGFIRTALKNGVNAIKADVDKMAELPEADYVIMLSSLYQFIPRHDEILDKLTASARKKVVISEPIKNVASSKNRATARLAGRLSDPGTGIKPHRFDQQALRSAIRNRAVVDSRVICGGREFFFVIDAEIGRKNASSEEKSDRSG
ncbi:MAG TPA: glycosyltransferase [bacterium]|nr:glycosyltransferase [bacterium]